MSKVIQEIEGLPKDLTPVQRAQLKLVSHLIMIAIFNALLSALVYFSGNTSGVNWNIIINVVIGQCALAVFDTARKYFTAQNDPTYASIVSLVATQLGIDKVAPVALTSAQQTTVSTIASAANTVVSSATPVVQAFVKEVNSKGSPTPAQTETSQDAQADAQYHDAQAASNPVDTLPVIVAVNARAQG